MEKIRIRGPGWKKFGSGIQDKHPGFTTLIRLAVMTCIIPYFLSYFFSSSRSEPSAIPVVSASPLVTPTNRVSAAAAAGPITTATPILSSAGAHYSAGKPVARVVPGRMVAVQILNRTAKFSFPIQMVTQQIWTQFFLTLYVC